ncbi:MAG: exodeoxyribonuclease VII small subunit [Defluviitaleaceae bacterium]|nr:exodeoxyribonuclease VII small subunit [Defluviitaleaceae bacterium]
MSKERFDFEENIKRLDEIIAAIEASDAPLEVSLALYKEGMALAANCAQKLADVEQEVELLTKNAAGMTERRDFAPMGDDE